MMRYFLALGALLAATSASAQSMTTVAQAKGDLEACLRANASLDLARAKGTPAAAKAALGKCGPEAGKLDRAVARASKEAGKTATQNRAATKAERQAVLTAVETFLAANTVQ